MTLLRVVIGFESNLFFIQVKQIHVLQFVSIPYQMQGAPDSHRHPCPKKTKPLR